MLYTTDQLALLSGVTTRTLRHYDQIGLLSPKGRNQGNVRLYGRSELETLQAILVYRRLGIPLDEIKGLLSSDERKRKADMEKHLVRLKNERDQIDAMIDSVARTLKEKSEMKDDELFHGFKQKMVEENEAKYGAEVRQKHGSDAMTESNRRLMKLSKQDMEAQIAMAETILTELTRQTNQVDPASEAGIRLADLHKRWLLYFWPNVEKDAHLGLARMYVEDERFAAYYEKAAPGAARHLLACIEAYYKE